MKDLVTVVVAGLAGLAIGFVAMSFKPVSVQPTQEQPTYAGSGNVTNERAEFRDSMTVGGKVFATSSRGSVTYTATSIATSKVIEHNAEAATTATLPTAALLSAAGFLQNVGDTATIYIHASTTQITLAGGTGVTLNAASSTKVILPNTTARIDFVRQGATENRAIWALMSTANQ